MKKYDPDTLNHQYNNRALVPDFADYFARWDHRSTQARSTLRCRLDVPYGNGLNETLDIFPSQRTQAPVLVFIHGGYWRSLDKADHSFVASAFVPAGACVVIPNYALCPAVTIPDIVMQMVKALAWTYRNIEAHGGDPTRISVVGHSAGGHLAAMLMACVWPLHAPDLPRTVVKNTLSISGLYDLEPVQHTPFLQASLRLTPAQVHKASPSWLAAPRDTLGRGTLCTVAGGDESLAFIEQNQLMQQAWGRRMVPVAEVLPGLNHFSVLDALVQPGHRLNQLALGLL
jgi:arylformamidase